MKSKKIFSLAVAVSILGGAAACSSSDNKNNGGGNTTNASQKTGETNSNNNNKDEKLDPNANVIKYSENKFPIPSVIPKKLQGDPVWAAKGKIVAATSKVAVIFNEEKAEDGVIGYDIATGDKLWKIGAQTPDSEPEMKLTNGGAASMGDVGDKLFMLWSGSIGGDALTKENNVSYAQSFDINTGKKLEEKKWDSQVNLNSSGIGYEIISNNDGENKYFYPEGFTDNKNDNYSLIQKYREKYNKNNYHINGLTQISKDTGIMILTKDGVDDGRSFLQVINTDNGKELTPIIDNKAKNVSTTPSTISVDGDYIILDNVMFNLKDNYKYKVFGDMSDTDMGFVSVNENGDVLATAQSTGPEKWVFIANNATKPEILDESGSEKAITLNGKYMMKTQDLLYSKNNVNWEGSSVIYKLK